MARLMWLPEALDDIERLYRFLFEKDADAAMKAAAVIHQAAILLEDNPRLGRPMPDDSGRREIFAAFGAGAYVLRYRLGDGQTPVVVRVWHSREGRS